MTYYGGDDRAYASWQMRRHKVICENNRRIARGEQPLRVPDSKETRPGKSDDVGARDFSHIKSMECEEVRQGVVRGPRPQGGGMRRMEVQRA